MSDTPQSPKRDPLDTACELVGRFQYHFSKIEAAMDHGIAKVLTLNDGSKDIVCANLDFWKKLNIIRSAVALQFEDKDKELAATLNKVMKINNYRQTVIHSTFEAGPDDSVRFSRVTAK